MQSSIPRKFLTFILSIRGEYEMLKKERYILICFQLRNLLIKTCINKIN